MRFRAAGALLTVAALGIGCSVPALAASRSLREQVDGVEMDLRDVQKKILELQAVQQSLIAGIADLRAALALDSPDRRSPADLAARLDSVETDLRIAQENQNEIGHRTSVLTDKVDVLYRRQARVEAAASAAAAPAGDPAASAFEPGSGETLALPANVDEESVGSRDAAATTGAAAPAGEPLLDPEEIYQTARADYGRGSHDLALSGFTEFLERFPASELADNALYWIGECHYSAGRLEDALAAFEGVSARFPEGDKAPDAAYKRALTLLELNRTAEGIIQLQHVKDTWPSAPAGRLSRTKLQSLGLL